MQKDQDIQIENDFGQKQKVCVWGGGPINWIPTLLLLKCTFNG